MARRSALFIESPAAFGRSDGPPLDARGAAFLQRMNAAGVAIVLLERGEVARSAAVLAALAHHAVGVTASVAMPAWSAKTLLRAAHEAGVDVFASWLVCGDPGALAAAQTAGLAGMLLIGAAPPPGDHGLVVDRADDLGDVPRVLVPRGGGCWHDHRPQ